MLLMSGKQLKPQELSQMIDIGQLRSTGDILFKYGTYNRHTGKTFSKIGRKLS